MMATFRVPWNVLGLLVVGGSALPSVAVGQSPERSIPRQDVLIVSGEMIKLSGAARGQTGSVDWVGKWQPSRVLNAGVVTFSLADATWTYARIGGSVTLPGRMLVRAQSDVGRGREGTGMFPYLVARAGASHQLAGRHVVIDLEEQYVHINSAVGHIGKIAIAVTPSTPVTVEAAYRSSFGGSLGVSAVTARVDRRFRRRSVFGGVSLGDLRSELTGLPGAEPARSTRELFGGAVIPLVRGSLTVGLDALWTPHTSRSSVVAAWSLPL